MYFSYVSWRINTSTEAAEKYTIIKYVIIQKASVDRYLFIFTPNKLFRTASIDAFNWQIRYARVMEPQVCECTVHLIFATQAFNVHRRRRSLQSSRVIIIIRPRWYFFMAADLVHNLARTCQCYSCAFHNCAFSNLFVVFMLAQHSHFLFEFKTNVRQNCSCYERWIYHHGACV